MAHLKGFGLENFRVFKEYTWFDFAPITILVGPNNSGKSSLIKALLLLKANKDYLSNLFFNKGDHELISFKRIIHNSNTKKTITFKIPIHTNDSDYLLLKYQYEPNSTSAKLIHIDIINDDGQSLEERLPKPWRSTNVNNTLSVTKEVYGKCFLSYFNYLRYLPMAKSKAHVKVAEFNTQEYHTRGLKFFKEWDEKFGLIIGETPLNELTGESQVTINGRLLTETGKGIQQIIALLFFIVDELPLSHEEQDEIDQYGGYTFILEEPEANLHPKFQSMLADMIVEAQKRFKIQFIIETHSEYLIRKLQYFTAKGDLKPEDVVIYYFNDPNNIPAGEKQVKKINILEDGSLSDDFGPGFYDEAATWELELLKLKRNKNRQN